MESSPAVSHQHDDGLPSELVVRKVAAVTDEEPTELRPLYDVIDPDALDRLCRHSRDRTARPVVEFSYSGHRVRVTGDGEVSVLPEE